MAAKVVLYRRANNIFQYLETSRNCIAEGDLVKIKGKLYMFHSGGFFTLFMFWPLIYFFELTWRFWEKFALPYQLLLGVSSSFKIPILLELKNVSANDIERLPDSLVNIDTYDIELAREMKKKFNCRASIHLLWCDEDGGLVFKAEDGHFIWHTWAQLANMDVITPKFQLSAVWHRGPKMWEAVRRNWGKTIFLDGGFKRQNDWHEFNPKFEASLPYVDGYYLRK